MKIDIEVGGPYPCFVTFISDDKALFCIRHTDLLALEHAVAEAKRQVLCKLPRNNWHEVDSRFAQNTGEK